MEDWRQAFYGQEFRMAFLSKKGQEFQDWFGRLGDFALRPDFQPVRSYGAEGDRKTDSRSLRGETVYQCYAPQLMKQKNLIAKIHEDLTGAIEYWEEQMTRWVFVHNDGRGLPPGVHKYLDALRTQHPSITIEIWSEAALARLHQRLNLANLRMLYGPAPSQKDREAVAPGDVEGVIRHLEQAELRPGEEPIRPPSVDKIRKNDLSEDVRLLLAVGKRKDFLVKKYFETHPVANLGEHIAEGFRNRYRSLKETERSPDDIFVGLQQYIGDGGSPRRQVAAFAVLSYLFDRCDIFEDPEDEP